MTKTEAPESTSGCSGHDQDEEHEHDQEEEKSGCTCGGLCGRRAMLENLKRQAPEAADESEAIGFELTPEPVS